MIDDRTQELLSRALDDDLDPEERSRLEARLATEPGLSERLVALRRLRAEVARLAQREAPPVVLDRLVEPLRRGRAPRRVVRPAFAWLAAAASVVVVATLSLEVARRSAPQPSPAREVELAAREQARSGSPAPSPGGSRYFRLAPLPQPAEPESVPQGAAERLLRDGPESPPVDPPQPLEVVGPLEEAPPGTREEVDLPQPRRKVAEESAGLREAPGTPAATAQARGSRSDAWAETRPAAPIRSSATDSVRPPKAVPAELAVAGRRLRFTVPAGLVAGELTVELVVRSGRVVQVRETSAELGAEAAEALQGTVAGLEVGDLADGTYLAVVRPASPGEEQEAPPER